MAMIRDLARQVVLTVGYSDQFAYPLTFDELHQRLLRVRASRVALRAVARWLVAAGLLHTDGHYIALSSSDVRVLANKRQESEQRAALKWAEVRRLTGFVSRLPLVLGVAVTGSVALNQVPEKGDVDFLIVTKRSSMWLVRPAVVFFAWLNGKRRSWSHEEGDSWCFNLWMEEGELALLPKRRNAYSAYEVCQAQWVLDREQTARDFYLQNRWVARYVPEFYHQCLATHPPMQTSLAVTVNQLVGELFLQITRWVHLVGNSVLWAIQRLYMRGHMTMEEVSLHAAFFHPRDTRGIIYKRWKDRLRLLLVSATVRSCRPVLATGVFDGLHEEHVRFLQKAKARADQLGTRLVVGIESDVRVRALKGVGRPIHDQADRLVALQQLGFIDKVFVLPEAFTTIDDYRGLLFALQPSILAVSSHTPHLEGKQSLMAEIGGQVAVVHEQNPAISTTILVSKGVYDTKEVSTNTS